MEPILRSLTSLVAGVCIGQSLLKLLSPQPRRWKRVLLYVLLGVTIGLPSWLGDENPILLFPFFMLGFLLLLPGDKLKLLALSSSCF